MGLKSLWKVFLWRGGGGGGGGGGWSGSVAYIVKHGLLTHFMRNHAF